MSTPRIERLKSSLFESQREISLERALLYTASHKTTEGEHTLIRRAKATAYVLDNVEISIREDELIAGNRTVKARAGIASPEMDPYWIEKELDIFASRPQDKFFISEQDKAIYRDELLTYWSERSMKDFINAQIPSEVKDAVAQKIFSVNQTDKGQGHIIIDFDRLLEHGLGSLLDEMQGLSLSNPDNQFYQSVVLLLEASIRHIYRYADLAQKMAEDCSDAERKAELVKIANISQKIATSKPQVSTKRVSYFGI
ncbi:pyruvate formate-lyase [Vibrio astriarenae]|nr:pyruvate formate-lyase [Vibrio sp. C7]